MTDLLMGERRARLEALGRFTAYYGGPLEPGEIAERIGDAAGIILNWYLPNEVLQATKNLEIVSFIGLGASNFIDIDEAARQGITVTHTISAAETVAEHTMALILAAARNIARLDRGIREGTWNTDLAGHDLRGKTLGLIGFGRIAQRTAPLAKAFGMRVIAWTRNPSAQRAARHDIEFADLDTVVGTSDVLSLHLLLTRETEGLINAEQLGRTKPGVIFVNTARQEILDEAALIELLSSGHIRAAGFDVFNREPLPRDHPFLTMENVVLTPHTAYITPGAVATMLDMAIGNLEAFFAGSPTNVAAPSQA
ncbi:MAG: 3-phosphoglycerate dehydrogenase [Alphaproteobacteria bacterium]|nr:3-phosphoglycerate dehydrogenase [Alphaproteobacteria bacterium]